MAGVRREVAQDPASHVPYFSRSWRRGRPRLSQAAALSPLQLGLSCWERDRERRRLCLIFVVLREKEK